MDVQCLQTLQHALEQIVSVEGVRVDEKLGRLDVALATSCELHKSLAMKQKSILTPCQMA